MSRIGKLPITVPTGVNVDIEAGNKVTVKGPKGTLTQVFDKDMLIEKEDGQITLKRKDDSKRQKAMHGLSRSLLNNMIVGVVDGFEKKLEIVGVGYRATLNGSDLTLNLGYSKPIEVKAPEGITFEVPTPNTISVKGFDKQLVGFVAAKIRDYRKPEPYLGKGVKYAGEVIRRKEGKSGA